MKKYIEENKKTVLMVIGFLLFIIVLEIIVKILGNDNKLVINSYVKKLTKEDITLTNITCNMDEVLTNSNIPYFKLNNQTYNELNNEILENFLLRACYQEGYIDYDISLNKNILSLAINISYETIDDLAYLEYKTYNIDTNTNQIYSNAEVLKKYNLTIEDINNKVLNRFTNYYNYEKENNWLENDITFNQFLLLINYQNISLDNMNLYIDKKNNLYLYKDYTLTEGMSSDENYPNLSVKFKLN